ncbi:hydrolase, partial [Enterococcus faecium]|nr:hydrolase [Enterococcus faecium]
ILVGQTSVKTQCITVASCHFSWWADEKSGFAFEWKELEASLAPLTTPLYLLGDFNNPAEGSGYDLVAKSQLPIRDAYPIAQKKQAEATIEKRIDGWENNKEGLRIDYIYVPQDCFVTSYQRIFDGENGPIVSDHYGVAVTLE